MPLSMLQSIYKELKSPTKDRDPRDGISFGLGPSTARSMARQYEARHNPRRFGSIARSNGCLEDIAVPRVRPTSMSSANGREKVMASAAARSIVRKLPVGRPESRPPDSGGRDWSPLTLNSAHAGRPIERSSRETGDPRIRAGWFRSARRAVHRNTGALSGAKSYTESSSGLWTNELRSDGKASRP